MKITTTLYSNIFEQVLAIELCKKELSKKILLFKEASKRQRYIFSFLNYDVNKHELLEHAAIIAYQHKEKEVLEKIGNFYKDRAGEDIMDAIKQEINLAKSLNIVVQKQINYPQRLSFVEKRRLSDINKYVLEQARAYMRVNK